MKLFSGLSLKKKVHLLLLSIGLMLTVVFYLLLMVTSVQHQKFGELIQNHVETTIYLNEIKDIYTINILDTLDEMSVGNIQLHDAEEIMVLSINLVNKTWNSHYRNTIDPSMHSIELVKNTEKSIAEVEQHMHRLVQMMRYVDSDLINVHINQNLRPSITNVLYFINDLYDEELNNSRQIYDHMDGYMQQIMSLAIPVVLLFVLFVYVLALQIVREIQKEIKNDQEEI